MCVCVPVLEEQCYEDMMTKFGMLVDLEALQTLSGNRKLEELRQRKVLREAGQDRELRQWDVGGPNPVAVATSNRPQVVSGGGDFSDSLVRPS